VRRKRYHRSLARWSRSIASPGSNRSGKINLTPKRDGFGMPCIKRWVRLIHHHVESLMKKFALVLAALSLSMAALAQSPAAKATPPAAPAATPTPAPVLKDVVDTAVAAGSFKTLATALQAAGLIEALKGKGPFTVFAPTDAAFAKIPAKDLEALLKDKAKLTTILQAHVVSGTVLAKDVKTMKAKTLGGKEIDVVVKDGKVTFGGAAVTSTDVMASNGVIHVIDTVVVPK
jgi:uncharacterized surface protein with fasciclin (FAS1) repeats